MMSTLAEKEYSRRWYFANREKQLASHRRWYLANREKQIAKAAQWAAANPEKRKLSQRKSDWRKAGINPDAALQRLRAHAGYCEICGSDKPGGSGGWHVDHDHRTGIIRGIVCSLCNFKLALIESVGIERFASYLGKSK